MGTASTAFLPTQAHIARNRGCARAIVAKIMQHPLNNKQKVCVVLIYLQSESLSVVLAFEVMKYKMIIQMPKWRTINLTPENLQLFALLCLVEKEIGTNLFRHLTENE